MDRSERKNTKQKKTITTSNTNAFPKRFDACLTFWVSVVVAVSEEEEVVVGVVMAAAAQ